MLLALVAPYALAVNMTPVAVTTCGEAGGVYESRTPLRLLTPRTLVHEP